MGSRGLVPAAKPVAAGWAGYFLKKIMYAAMAMPVMIAIATGSWTVFVTMSRPFAHDSEATSETGRMFGSLWICV